MNFKHQSRNKAGRYSLSRFALLAAPALIASALLINAALPTVAHSQINGRVTGAPQVSASHSSASPFAQKPALPKAPAQVEMPAPPPMRIVPGMEEALVATGEVTERESQDLDAALKEFHDAPLKAEQRGDYADYVKPLLAFIEAHPKSNWNAALQLNLGLGYYHAGYFSRAFTSFEKAWQLGRNATEPHAHLMVQRAVGELAKMHARVGHAKELEALLKDVGSRPIGGPATELIQGAREGLWQFHHNPGEAYLCGPNALKNVLIMLKAKPEQLKVTDDARSGKHGFSLTQLAALAGKTGLKYTLIHREPGQPIPVPSIINWKIHHYAAILAEQNGRYQIADPTFGEAGVLAATARTIDEESSGYFLVPAKAMSVKAGLAPEALAKGEWRKVSAHSSEAQAVYGMGRADSSAPECTRCDGTQISTQGMAVANAHSMVVSLHINDTPVGYQPQKGGTPMFTQLTYNQREGEQPATFGFSNVSPKWSFTWMKSFKEDPANPGASPRRVWGGGGGLNYVFYYANGGDHGIEPGELPDNSVTWRYPITSGVPTTKYVRNLPDGSQEVYALNNGATTNPKLYFLTSVIDPHGNTTTYNYDSTFRLTSVVDAMGRSTTFTYGLSASPLLITQITDPFGRTSQLTYDTSGRLASITDPVGITSSFTYSTTDTTFITSLTTPYGVSKFNETPNPHDTVETNTRSLMLTDPLGYTDFLYFYQNTSIVPATDPTAVVPTGMTTNGNGLLQWRNTFYWDRHAFALGATISGGVVQSEDFTKARITHWVHQGGTNYAYDMPESTKAPLENRVWYNYPSQPSGYYEGNIDKLSAKGRVLDDGTTQLSKATYTAWNNLPGGQPATATDAKGRSLKYTYATNQIDLLTVQQLTTAPSTYTTIATFGSYNTQHEPQTYTDAAGKVWHYTYNTFGQLATITDPNGGVTTRNYDSSGRLSSITNANSQTQASYTYDSADRIQTYTDSEGYVLTYAYDNLDRVTSITYPDGTTDLYDYSFQSGPNMGTQSLELRKHIDRLGRVTTYGYDADRRLTSVTEPTSGTGTRTTSYSYYENGTLKEITDANGNVTHWDIDIQSRPIDKIYAFGTSSAQTETYTYENTTSRLKSITDALGQVKTFTYDQDDRIKGITYTSTVNPTPNVTYTWDSFFPRISSMTDGLGTTNFSYTAIGTAGALKLASVTGPFTNNTISLTYDALGRLSGRNITGGNETFGYDAINRMTSHGTPLGSFTNTYLGQTDKITSRSVTNGTVTVSTSWSYDSNANDRRLISIANSGVTRSYTLGYGSSPVNPYDIMSITDTAATGHPFATQSHNYSYDNVDRLLTASSTTPGNYSYGYDNLDNATSVTDPGFGSTSPTYNGLNQVQAFNTNTYTYDNNGNTSSDGFTKNYKWDAENRLIEIDYIGTTAKSQFSYDGMGRRTVDIETDALGGVTTRRFLWCDGRVCQTRDGSDTVLRRDLDEGEFVVASSQKLIYMPDQLGSVRDVLDAGTGNLISSIDYSPYGNAVQTNGSTPTDYQYAGLIYHPQSALSLAMHRAYDPVTFRFPNRDPIAERGGGHPYTYTGADPINMFDPSGLAQCQYSVSTHTLDCVSNAGGNVNSVGPNGVFSGRGMCRNNDRCFEQSGIGPIVPGNYNMNQDTRPGKEGFWRLEPNPKIPWWKFYSGFTRSGFEFHPGGISAGCITVDKTNTRAMDQYNNVNSLLGQENGSNQLTVVP